MMPAKQVSTAAAMGVTIAAMGRRVGSEPVSTTGNVMLRMVATSQTVSVATARPIQMGRRDPLPRSLPIAHRNPPVATKPQSHVPKAATGKVLLLAARNHVRGQDADQHHSSPDACQTAHAPHHPRAIGHRPALIRVRYLHLSHRSFSTAQPPDDGPCGCNGHRYGGDAQGHKAWTSSLIPSHARETADQVAEGQADGQLGDSPTRVQGWWLPWSDPASLAPSPHRPRVATGDPPPGGARRSRGRMRTRWRPPGRARRAWRTRRQRAS
jgi:hypothetical protein